MKKIQNLKLLWKKLCDAKQKKESSLNTIIAPYWYEEKEKQSCLRQKNVGTDREPLIVFCKCDDFNLHVNCKKAQCPYVEKNLEFSAAHKEYVSARCDFIKGLFKRTK